MGVRLSREQQDFIGQLATAPALSAEELEAGIRLLQAPFAASTVTCEYHATTLELINTVADPLFVNAVDANRIGQVLDFARRQLDAVSAAGEAASAVDRQLASASVRLAQTLLSMAIARHDGCLDVVLKLCNTNNEASALHTAAVVHVARGMLYTSTPDAVCLHADVLLLLLTYYSSALYHPALPTAEQKAHHHDAAHDVHADMFIDAVAYHDDRALVKMFGASLLNMVSTWGMLRMGVVLQYKSGYEPSLLNLYNWLGMANRSQRVDVSSTLASRALHIYCVMVTYKKPAHMHAGKQNVFIELLVAAGEGGDAAAEADGDSAATAAPQPGSSDAAERAAGAAAMKPLLPASIAPSTFELLVTLSRRVETLPELAVLLYALLIHRKAEVLAVLSPANHSNSGNRATAEGGVPQREVTAQLLGDLLTSLAHVSYDCVASSGIAPLSFLVGTIFLLLSVESDFVTTLFSINSRAPWYKERYCGDISVGSIIVTVVSRTAARAIALGNHDIAELNLGILANMAPYVHDLHTIAGQRLATMLKHMLKRLKAARDAVASDSTDYAASATLQSIESHCCLTIDVMLGILDGASRNNHSLLYDLLHQKPEIFTVTAEFAPGTPIAEAVAPLAKLVGFYESELASFSITTSVDDVMRVIRKVSDDVSAPDIVVGAGGRGKKSGDGDGEGITACERNVFEYVEDEEAYEYFATLLWRSVLAWSGTVLTVPVARTATNHVLLSGDVNPVQLGSAADVSVLSSM